MNFTKINGCGNDGILLDAIEDGAIAPLAAGAAWPAAVRAVCDRHAGIGADFVAIVQPPDSGIPADARMRIFNADGAEAQMCSTAIRAAAKLLVERHGFAPGELAVQTGAGVLTVRALEDRPWHVASASVAMGVPILDPRRIPTTLASDDRGRALRSPLPEDLLGLLSANAMPAAAQPLASCVSMGNPHLVIWCADPDAVDLPRLGPRFETHPAFPERVNTHFVRIVSRSEVIARHWERGCGATLACGTGSCAIVVAGVLTDRLDRSVRVRVPGGEFRISWPADDAPVRLDGPIEEVFRGTFPDARLGVAPRPPAPPVSLRTERLLLRPFAPRDIDAIVQHLHDGVIARTTLLIPHPYTERDARKWLAGLADKAAQGQSHVFAICDASDPDGQPFGAIGLRIDRAHAMAELGYWVAQARWGQGTASEASRALIDHAFTTLGLHRVFAYHFAGNDSSGRVMQKAGMSREGLALSDRSKGDRRMDSVLFGITRAQWERNRSAAPTHAEAAR